MSFLLKKSNDEDVEEKKVDASADNVKDALRLEVHSFNDRLKISVIPPTLKKKGKRFPVFLSCVVDTSGSMGCDAVIKDENGKSECHGLSILDLVKHSILTIIECLNKHDYLSIISYSNEAKIVTNLIPMNKRNKKKTLKALNELQAEGQTNLWQGLFHGLEQLRACKDIDSIYHNSAVMLFTDGLPNIVPPKGHNAMLADYMKEHKQLNGVIHTYGFGYSLDTKLLIDLAVRGNGYYSFIPDATMVGTVFVHSLANFCCNIAKNVELNVAIKTKDYHVIGGHPNMETDKGVNIQIGNIMYGQQKDIIIRWTTKEGANIDMNIEKSISLSYISLNNNQFVNAYDAVSIIEDDKKNTEMNYYRLLLCDVLRECMKCTQSKDIKAAQTQLKDLIRSIAANPMINKEQYMMDLVTDLKVQCFEAISNEESYAKWGKHYLPSLIFAHLHQHCNNFKDPGVQHYGGQMFTSLRDKANDIFIKMDAPKSSYKPPAWLKEFGAIDAQPVRAPNVAMSSYMNAHGGCFAPDCKVLMADGSLKCIKELMFEDRVYGGAMVRCIIKYECKDNKAMMCTLKQYNDLQITPFHPIKIMDEWVFPKDFGTTKEEECSFVFNVLLSHNHILVVNGVECCSLAHHFQGNVIQHPYFGTNEIVKDLRKCSGWNNGEIVLASDAFMRDPISGLICAVAQT